MTKQVREPIQVYLSSQERDALDRAAAQLGASRSEVLRRGVEAVRSLPTSGLLRDVAADGLVTPASMGPGDPPPRKPVAPLATLLRELDQDRGNR